VGFQKTAGCKPDRPVFAKAEAGVRSSFFLRYNYVVKPVNIETGLKMVYFQQQKGSPWFQKLEDAEK